MSSDQKIILGVAIISALILGVAVFSFSSSAKPTEPVDQTLLVRDNSNKTASSSAKVTLVEFGDYQCPACALAHPITKQLLAEYQGQVNFVFRHFPLPQHPNAMISAKAAEAAGEQGKYWEMHNKIYETQPQWENDPNAAAIFTDFAKELGLNENQFNESMNSDKFFSKINGDKNDGEAVGVNSTPTFFINGVKARSFKYNELKQQIDQALQ